MLSVVLASVIFSEWQHAECCLAEVECRYTERHFAGCLLCLVSD